MRARAGSARSGPTSPSASSRSCTTCPLPWRHRQGRRRPGLLMRSHSFRSLAPTARCSHAYCPRSCRWSASLQRAHGGSACNSPAVRPADIPGEFGIRRCLRRHEHPFECHGSRRSTRRQRALRLRLYPRVLSTPARCHTSGTGVKIEKVVHGLVRSRVSVLAGRGSSPTGSGLARCQRCARNDQATSDRLPSGSCGHAGSPAGVRIINWREAFMPTRAT
jgi:hypothetical protein